MYKLPIDREDFQNFAQQEGGDCAIPVILGDGEFEKLNVSSIAKSVFAMHIKNGIESGNIFCDDVTWGEEIFITSFLKGFIISQNRKIQKDQGE